MVTTELFDRMRGLSLLDCWQRKRAIATILEYPLEQIIPVLERGVRDHENADMRNASMEVFRALGDQAFSALASLMRDSDPEVRLFSVNILYEIGDPASLPLLLGAVDDADVNVRAAAIEALGKMRDPQALSVLVHALDDEPWVAAAAIHAMGEIGGQDALGILLQCLDRSDAREMALVALERSGDLDALIPVMRLFDDNALKGQAVKTFVAISERQRHVPQAELLKPYADMFGRMFAVPDPELRKAACRALSWSGSSTGVPFLIKAVKDEELQEYAICGLLQTGGNAVSGITRALRMSVGSHRAILAKILGMLHAEQALIEFADDEDPEVRTEVALALGSVEAAEAEGLLLTMLADPHEEVQLAARRSLRLLKHP